MTARKSEDAFVTDKPPCECCGTYPCQKLRPVSVEGQQDALRSGRLYPFPVSRVELGLLIDGVAKLVQSPEAEAAPLLRRLQDVYRASLEVEPKS